MRGLGSIPTGVTLFTGFFCFHVVKSSAANIGIIAILVHFEKKLLYKTNALRIEP